MSSARTSLSGEVGSGHTALMRAALEGDTAHVKALLRRGANVNVKDLEGHTALMFAVVKKSNGSARLKER
ncbi:MAG TPA: ankyrin repeat domain-containing protein [Pyrinomonadaceae bacterium]